MLSKATEITFTIGGATFPATVTNIEAAQDRALYERFSQKEVTFECELIVTESVMNLYEELQRLFWLEPENGETIYDESL